MSSLQILFLGSAELAEAPEFRYLALWVEGQARQVWGDVERVGSLDEASSERPLLLVGERVLLGRASLEALRSGLQEGREAQAPLRLSELERAPAEPIYTLAGFERAEHAALEARGTPGLTFPALLLAPSAWRRLATVAPERWLEPATLAGAGLEAELRGLCHEFIDYYGEVRSDIRPFVPTPCREVLEVGCGRGATGRWLQEETGCRVTGVELNPVVARAAAGVLHRVVAGDVLSVEIDGSYDWILALELFEHLVEPLEFLARAERLLEPGGRILLSVPNVGHYSVVEDLLAGRWDYLPIGLLCSTHYRFFTRRTLVDWLVGAGFERFEIVPQRTEVPERLLRLPLPVDAESLGTKGFYVQIERRRGSSGSATG